MSSYERYCQIRNIRQLKDAQVATIADMGKSTFSDWKSGRSIPKDDKIRRIATALDVTPEYLKGDTTYTICSVCGAGYDLLNKHDCENHEVFHNKVIKVKEKYSFCNFSDNLRIIRENSIIGFRNKNYSLQERLDFWDQYLKSSYCIELSQLDYNIDNLTFEDYCKTEVASLKPDHAIDEEFIERLADIYLTYQDWNMGLFDDEEGEEEDPRAELVQKLLEYKMYKYN